MKKDEQENPEKPYETEEAYGSKPAGRTGSAGGSSGGARQVNGAAVQWQ